MGELVGSAREQFETLHRAGQGAKDSGDHDVAESHFFKAASLAREAGDDLKLQHALSPLARALWSQGRYDEAQTALEEAKSKAPTDDERAIAESNIGRLAARRVLGQIPGTSLHARAIQARRLRTESLPHFIGAYGTLKDHPHRYYDYANDTHGSVVAALAGQRLWALRFAVQGLRVARQPSSAQYNHERPIDVNRKGLTQMAGALALTPLGSFTPILARKARSTLVR
jgi:tetratricopeptide (TPR) repeat protein